MQNTGYFAHSIASTIDINASTISRLHFKRHSKLYKYFNDYLTKLFLANIYHSVYLIAY